MIESMVDETAFQPFTWYTSLAMLRHAEAVSWVTDIWVRLTLTQMCGPFLSLVVCGIKSYF